MSYRDVAIEAAKTSGKIARDYFGHLCEVRFKTRKDLVTQADVDTERSIVSIIRESCPEHRIMGEELPAHESGSPYQWLIDPIDGTTNFVAGIPMFSLSIALCYEDESVLAVIYDPLRSELFCAEKGRGAYLGGCRLSVGSTSKLEDCVVSYARSYHPPGEILARGIEIYERLLPRVRALRQLGGCALDLCYVAAGRLDATITVATEAESKLEHPAGCLMVDEAGGKSSDFSGHGWHRHSTSIIAANAGINAALVDLLQA